MKVLLTGATGFVGRYLYERLLRDNVSVTPVVRSKLKAKKIGAFQEQCYIEVSCNKNTDWHRALKDVTTVIHCAAIAHGKPGDLFSTNVEGTLNLARQAAEANVKRFLFISSIGVSGILNSYPFTEDDSPKPVGQYAKSKWEAEKGLLDIQHNTGMEVVIIRPPLVYGPNAPGNFGSLVRWVGKGVPLPLGSIYNKRTLVALDNLVDLVVTCVYHPAAANQVFLAGDGQDVSTTELLRGVGRAMGKPARLISVPADLLMLGASLLGKKAVAQRLLGSLQVDISKARNVLGWEPPLSVEEGLRRCFVSENKY